MRLTLRDLFWLMLLVAAVTAWWAEHRKGAKEIEENRRKSWLLRTDRGAKPGQAELKRRAAQKRFAKLTDDELDRRLGSLLVKVGRRRDSDYEPCLMEMARRRLVEPLQRHYDALMEETDKEQPFLRFPDNLELLTALRRAGAKPDPLTIELVLNDRPPWAANYDGPCLQAIVRNSDIGHEAVDFMDGGDDRGGRRERWRLELSDEQGTKVADSNYCPMMGGGLCGFGPLKYGDTGDRFNFLELRKYVAPPRSGKYQLQAKYHNDIGIANERDVSGLIVSKSESIWVVVENKTPLGEEQKWQLDRQVLGVLVACAALMLASVVSGVRRKSGRSALRVIARRDVLWCGIVVAMVIGIFLDRCHQASQIVDVRPDAEAKWSIRLADVTK